MAPFLTRWFVTTIAVLVAIVLVPGIEAGGGVISLLGASLFLGIANALARPVLLLLSLPLILLTLGLFILVINALLLWAVGGIVPGFVVEGFGSAILGALIISIVSWIMSAFFRDSTGKIQILTHHDQRHEMKPVRGRVVDE